MSINLPSVRFLDRRTPPHIVTLVFIAGLSAMNMSVFLPSLPDMAAYFGTSYGVMQLSVSLYLGATAVLQLIIGPIADRYGRRNVMLTTIILFLLATLGCLLATTVEVFLAFRMAQAAVASGIVLSRAVVRDMVPQNEAASMIGYVTMGMALVPMIAPMIGGALDQALGWQSVFVFLLLAGCAIWALVFFDQGETARPAPGGFAAQFRDTPELMKSRRFWGYVFCAAFAAGSFFAFLGGAPYVATDVYGLTPAQTGFALGMPAVGYATGNFISGRYSVRYGIDAMILVGTIVTALGLGASLLSIFAGWESAVQFFVFCTFVGLGNGLVMPNSSAGLLSVRPRLAGTASGLGSAIMIGGGAGLSALAGVVLELGDGATPLIWLMFASATLAIVAIVYVIRRTTTVTAS
ncbi:MAG: multidrug effflux MFS transporter [Brevirhabdus sp.]